MRTNKQSVGDIILEKIGSNGRYQKLMLLILILIGTCTDFYMTYITLMETPPFLDFKDSEGHTVTEQSEYSLCKKEHTINTEKSKHTWVLEYDLFCSKLKVSLLGSLICIGCMIGALAARFVEKIGIKKSVLIFCSVAIIATGLLYIKNYYVLLFCNVCFGFTNVTFIILKNTIITEMTNNISRAGYLSLGYLTQLFDSLLSFSLFSIDFNWRLLYGLHAVCLAIFLIPFYFLFVENPIFYWRKGEINKTVESLLKISKINKKEENTQESLQIFIQEDVKSNKILNTASSRDEENPRKITDSGEGKENDLIHSELTSDLLHSNTSKVQKRQSPTYKLCILIIMFSIFSMENLFVTFELKLYSNSISVLLYNIFLALSIVAFFISSFFMNIDILGRKMAMVIFYLSVIITRVLKIVIPSQGTLFFFISRTFVYGIQLPVNTIITESFSSKIRVLYYGYIYFVGKIVEIATPFLLEYINIVYYDYVLISVSIIAVIVTFLIEETWKKPLED
jgi:hypothetical protein